MIPDDELERIRRLRTVTVRGRGPDDCQCDTDDLDLECAACLMWRAD